ncbi:MAG: hypothetical protein HFJ86_06275 [Oscillospiraceae bacterium]|jgi:hypothetical protein|nr:hypothetical protein [Oscillospiraceae bacterium]
MNRQTKQDLKDACFVKNPVLMQGAALTVLVLASTSLSSAGVASLAMVLSLLPGVLLAGVLAQKVARSLLLPLYVLIGTLAYIPVYFLLQTLFPTQVYTLGLALPLTAVCGVSLFFEEQGNALSPQGVASRPFLSLPARLIQVLTFPLVLCVTAFLRESLSHGDLKLLALPQGTEMPALLLPFAGFLTLGFVVALLQALHMGVAWLLRLLRKKKAPHVPKDQKPDETLVY